MKSIRFKLWLGMMFLVSFMLLLLWLFQIVFLEQFYLEHQINRLSDKSSGWVQELEVLDDLSEISTNQSLRDSLDAFAYTYHLNLEVIDIEGKLVYEATSNADQQAPNMFRKSITEILNKALTGEKVLTTLEHPRFDTAFLVMGEPIVATVNSKATVTGVFILNAPLAPVSDTAYILKQQLILITIILLIVAFILAFMISKHFSKPLSQISRVAKEMSKGQFDTRIRKVSKDEIGQLAAHINEMGVELKRTDLLRKELIGNISHELRTPLSLIRGYAETIRDVSGEQTEKRNKHIGIIINESERLGCLIDDILKLSQLEVGAVKLDQKGFDLVQLLHKVQKGFEDLAVKKQISFEMKTDSSLLAMGDEARIEQVLYNLIGNAFQHTLAGGHIEVLLEKQASSIRVAVKDDGAGIPQEELGSIWERYYKASSTGEKISGTGLGLAIVKSILVAHQVRYGVESKIGAGSTFWFELTTFK